MRCQPLRRALAFHWRFWVIKKNLKIVECIWCSEKIKRTAKICHHCNREQKTGSYKAYLTNTTVIFSLLLSLISLSTTFYNLSKSMIDEKIANIEFDILTTTGDAVSLLIRNEGTVPGVVTRGMISNSMEGGPSMAFTIPIRSPVLIKSGEYKVLEIVPYGGVPQHYPQGSPDNKYKCELVLWVVQLGKTEKYTTKSFGCFPNEMMYDFLNDVRQLRDSKDSMKREVNTIPES